MRSENVCRYDGCKVGTVLLMIRSILDIQRAFSIAVTKIGDIRWPVVDLFKILLRRSY